MANEKHDGATLWSHAKITFTGVPFDIHRRSYKDPLTPEERKWFESGETGLGLVKNDMSILKKDNFWSTFTVALDRNGMQLDLSDVMDYLRYKFLLVQPQVAETWDQRYDSAMYKFAMVDDEEQMSVRIGERERKAKANRLFGKFESSVESIRAFLNLYTDCSNVDKKLDSTTSQEFMIAQVDELMETNLTKFLEIVDEPNFEYKRMIYRALEKGAVIKEGKAKYKIFGEAETFSLTELVEFLKDPENSLMFVGIQATLNGNIEEPPSEEEIKPLRRPGKHTKQ